jgi:hypothetical protein
MLYLERREQSIGKFRTVVSTEVENKSRGGIWKWNSKEMAHSPQAVVRASISPAMYELIRCSKRLIRLARAARVSPLSRGLAV